MARQEPGTKKNADIDRPVGVDGSPPTYGNSEKKSNYLPWIMRPRVLLVLSAVPLLVLGVAFYISQSLMDGTGMYSETADEGLSILGDLISQFFLLTALFIIGLFYSEIDGAVKKMEPFYQLSRDKGASGWGSLCIDYSHYSEFFAPFIALRHQHWAVFFSSLASTISMNANRIVNIALSINSDFDYSWIIGGFLGLISILGLVLALLISLRDSGLDEFPTGFEGLMKFTKYRDDKSLYDLFSKTAGIDHMSNKELDNTVGPCQFGLRRRDTGPGARQFDIVVIKEAPLKTSKNRMPQWLWKDCHPRVFQTIPISITIARFMALFVLVNAPPFWQKLWSVLDSAESSSAGAKVISLIVNTVIIWKIVDEAKIIEPLYILRRSEGAPYSALQLDYTKFYPLQDLFKSFKIAKDLKPGKFSDYTLFFILLGSYGTEFFTIGWIIMNRYTGHRKFGFWIGFSMMIFCEVLILFALGAIVVYRRQPVFPRQPTNIASMLSWVYANDIIEESKPLALDEKRASSGSPSSTQVHRDTNLPAIGGPPTSTTKDKTDPVIGSEGGVDQDDSIQSQPTQEKRPSGSEKVTEDPGDISCAFGWFSGKDGKEHLGIARLQSRTREYKFGEHPSQPNV